MVRRDLGSGFEYRLCGVHYNATAPRNRVTLPWLILLISFVLAACTLGILALRLGVYS